jgi:uncharacterized membrane protein YiaA
VLLVYPYSLAVILYGLLVVPLIFVGLANIVQDRSYVYIVLAFRICIYGQAPLKVLQRFRIITLRIVN